MRTRWLHSPLRTAGISTALFAAEHAIDVAEVNDRLLHKFGISYTGVAASGIIPGSVQLNAHPSYRVGICVIFCPARRCSTTDIDCFKRTQQREEHHAGAQAAQLQRSDGG